MPLAVGIVFPPIHASATGGFMRHILALLAVLVLAGICLAAGFESTEAQKAQADYESALKAAKSRYGQRLARAKTAIDEKKEAATAPVIIEAYQKESSLLTEELVRLLAELKGEAEAGDAKEFKTDEARQARAEYQAALKAVKFKYSQELTNAQRAALAKKAANPDAAAKQSLQREADLITEELRLLGQNIKVGKTKEPVEAGRKAKGKGSVPAYLTECEPKTVQVGWSKMLVNKTADAPVPSLDGKPCTRFIWAHAPSSLMYDLTAFPGKRKFVAIGYMANDRSTNGVVFIVRIDGTEVFRSNKVDGKTVVSVPVVAAIPAGSKVLELVVDDLRNLISDWSYWVEPRLEE
jgi:hypothetical protein